MIQPIVEGHGEVPAVPVLLRKLAVSMAIPWIDVGKPIRRPRSELVKETGLAKAIELARLKPGCRAILILFDADDDCPKTFGPTLCRWAATAARGTPTSVVLANREYEGWLLHALPSLLGVRSVHDASPFAGNAEHVRDAKGTLEMRMSGGYSETADQAALTQAADWQLVHERSRSGRKLIKEARRLFAACRLNPAPWPPQT
jgi:hypothetical protein